MKSTYSYNTAITNKYKDVEGGRKITPLTVSEKPFQIAKNKHTYADDKQHHPVLFVQQTEDVGHTEWGKTTFPMQG